MKKTIILSSILGVSLLAACGNETDNATVNTTALNSPVTANDSNKSSNSNSAKDISSSYAEVATIKLEGYIASTVFDLDTDGDTLLWGEQDEERAEPKRVHVWNDGNHKPMSLEEDQLGFQSLSGSGKVIYNDSDWDKPVNERHSIMEYDPMTMETATFTMNDERDEILAGLSTNYSESPRMFIGIQDYKKDNIQPFIWNVDTNEITDIDLTETIRAETQEELPMYPHYSLNQDQSKLVAVVYNVGIIVYDMQSKQSEWVFKTDQIFTNNEKSQSSILTKDGRYVLYYTGDTPEDMVQMAFDLESKESIKIGNGITTFPLDDGNVMLVTGDNAFQLFNMETKELITALVPEMSEDDHIDHYTVSLDGSTIAYVLRDKENTSTIHIYQK